MRWLFVGLLIAMLFQSCKKDDNLGLDLIRLPGDMFGYEYTDTSTLLTWSMMEDSLLTSGVYLHLLGSYADPVFGHVTSGIYTQTLLSTNNVNFGSSPQGDSLVLTLQYQGYYGDSLAKHRLRIYEIDPSASFYKDSSYYSNQQLQVGDLLFDDIVTFNAIDSVNFNGKKVLPLLKVNLNAILMQKFINASGTADLSNNDAFRNFFKGLYLQVDEITVPGDGSIAYFNMNADLSKLTLYYHNDEDTLSYPFVINDQCAKFSRFDHAGYQHAEHGLLNQDTGGFNEKLYIQAMAGVRIHIKLPYITDLYKDGPVAVNRAELVIKADPSDVSAIDFTPSPKLAIARINDEGKNSIITDALEGETFLGGSYDATRKEYRFRITRHLYDILSGRYNNHGLVLMVSAASIRANRAVILGNTATEKNLKLEIVYTKP